MNIFTFKKGRPVFGHNTKRSRPEDVVDLREEYIQENFDVHFDFDYPNPEEAGEAEEAEEAKEADKDTCLERLDEDVILQQEEMFDNQFNAFLQGAKILQGSNVTVNISPKVLKSNL